MPDFLLARQAAKLADLAATAAASTDGATRQLAGDLDAVVVDLAGRVDVPAGEPGPDVSVAAALDTIIGIAAVCDLSDTGARTAAQLRWVLARHGRPVPGDTCPPDTEAAPEGTLRLVDTADDGAYDEDYEGYDDAPVRRLLLVAMRRVDGHALTAVEAGAGVGALEATFAPLGGLRIVAAPALGDDGTAVTAVAVDSDDAVRLDVTAMPAGNVVFDGVLPLVGVDVTVTAVLVDDTDAPTGADGGVDVDALVAGTDADAVLAAAGNAGDTIARLRADRDERLAEVQRAALVAGDHEGAADIAAVRAGGLPVVRDDAGRALIGVVLSRRDGGRLDGADLAQVRDVAMRTLPRFGRLEEVAVDVTDGRTVVTLAVADDTGEVTAADVAAGLVVWQGTLPFPGVGQVDAELMLPAPV